jgi:hypothetical protein
VNEAAQTALVHLERLAARGRRIGAALRENEARDGLAAEMRAWQTDVAVAVNELSGGSKAHWLSKAFSAAYLIATPQSGDRQLEPFSPLNQPKSVEPGAKVRTALVVEAPARDIVDRLLAVVAQAHTSLTQVAAGGVSIEPPAPRRFEFVHDAAVRPVLEQACTDAEHALEGGDAERAFMTFCSVLEAIITDALHHAGIGDLGFGVRGDSGEGIGDQSQIPNPESQRVPTFDERIAAAESAGLIHAGCARLPSTARRYRERHGSDAPASTRDARVVRQVLHVVMRDLDPGR